MSDLAKEDRPDPTRPMVESINVHKRFGGLPVLKGIDLTVQRGSVTCLVGPSGSGKTTMLRCINHLEQITAGRRYVQGGLMGHRPRGGKLPELHPRAPAQQPRDNGPGFPHFKPL